MTRRTARSTRVAALTLGALALTGCAHDPGNAFTVAGTSVSRDTVNTLVRAQCSLIADAAAKQGSSTAQQPRSALTWSLVDAMVQSTMENAYGNHYSVDYDGTDVRKALAQLPDETSSLPDAQAKILTSTVVDVLRGRAIAESVGAAALKKQGAASTPSADETSSTGYRIIRTWAQRQGVSVNPRYNVGSQDRAGAGDGSVSTPVTSFAKASARGATSTGFVSELPPGQLCG